MSIISPPIAPLDRRQSPTALAVSRGTQRLLVTLGLSCVAELPLMSGRRADLVALGGDGEIWIVEIKSRRSATRRDLMGVKSEERERTRAIERANSCRAVRASSRESALLATPDP